jgi:trehalose-6-phosphate synthase
MGPQRIEARMRFVVVVHIGVCLYVQHVISAFLLQCVDVLVQHTTRWVGWPGAIIDEPQDRMAVANLLMQHHQCIPVWVDKDLHDLYYNGFCNGVLWQLFHYVPVQTDFKLSETHTLEQQWSAYVAANVLFADATCSDYRDGDVVWIQDYHLMLLPELLKQRRPSMKVRLPGAKEL